MKKEKDEEIEQDTRKYNKTKIRINRK